MKIRTSGSSLALAMAFLATVFGCERSTEPTASNLGRITIQVNIDDVYAPWTLTGSSYEDSSRGDMVLEDMHPGDYTICWKSDSLYIAPPSEEKILLAGGSISFTGNYIEEGTIDINPEPDEIDAPWILSGPDAFCTSGSGDSSLLAMSPGSYSIVWDSVPGWIAPAGAASTLEEGGCLLFTGAYFELGSITIDPSPDVLQVPWTLYSGEEEFLSGAGDTVLYHMIPDIYGVLWEPVACWYPCGNSGLFEQQTMEIGDSLIFQCEYSLAPAEFIIVSSDSFWMGAHEGEFGANANEYPRHQVYLSHTFALQATEVTYRQYIEVAQWAIDYGHATATSLAIYDALDGSSIILHDLSSINCEIDYHSGDGQLSCWFPDYPMREADWRLAAAFCDWLSLKKGLPRAYDHSTWQCNGGNPYLESGYRLPTEAEWEYACRAGTETPFNTGECLDSETQANYDGTQPYDQCSIGPDNSWIVPVGLYESNGWGFYDMHGNVKEWCNDWYISDYYQTSMSNDPYGPASGTYHVVRGGDWSSNASRCRSAWRWGVGTNSGIRPARTIY